MAPMIPGFGGGMFPVDSGFGLPDFMGGINEALAQNQALGAEQAEKPDFGKAFGQFLRAWAGNLGDSLTGNPAYARSMQAQAEAQAAEAARQREQEWWYEQQRYKAENTPPDRPEIAEQYDWYRGLSPEQRQQADPFIQMMRPGMQAPVVLPHDVEPVSGGAASAGGIRGQAIEAIRQGADPTKVLERLKQMEGGQAGVGSPGGFL